MAGKRNTCPPSVLIIGQNIVYDTMGRGSKIILYR